MVSLSALPFRFLLPVPFCPLGYVSFCVSLYPVHQGFSALALLTSGWTVFLLWAVLCIVACVVTLLAFTYHMPVVPLGHVYLRYLQILGDVPAESGGLALAEYALL